MSETEAIQITDASGMSFNAWLKPKGEKDDTEVLVQLTDGIQFLIPRDLLEFIDQGHYILNVSLREYALRSGSDEAEDTVIRLAEEKLNVGKRTVERARVRVTKRVIEREEIVDQPLMREEVMVEHVPINQVVAQVVPVRYEDDVTIIPRYEEVLVLEKKLMLVEEIRVTRRQTEYRDPQVVVLRHEEAVVERDNANLKDDETA
jgi:uncharacterized protein (TIGR02271 family)